MEPIFDKKCSLVGWLNQESENVFNTRMQFIAFIRVMACFLIVVGM